MEYRSKKYTKLSDQTDSTFDNNNSDGLESFEYMMKIVIVGDSFAGKSALLRRYVSNHYPSDSYVSTIGVDFDTKRISFDNKDRSLKIYSCKSDNVDIRMHAPSVIKTKLQIWDTAGQERFRSITESYYRGMKLCVLCFDSSICDDPVHSITAWLHNIKKHSCSKTYVYIVGSKVDNKNEMYDADLENQIKQIGLDGLIVKFVGWCSSAQDTYAKSLKDLSGLNQQTKQINSMFKDIVYDFMIEESKLGEKSSIKIYDYNNEYGGRSAKLEQNASLTNTCCTIL